MPKTTKVSTSKKRAGQKKSLPKNKRQKKNLNMKSSKRSLKNPETSLLIKNIPSSMVKKLLKDEVLFNKFFKINKGLIDECVLKVINRDKLNKYYDDYFQAACMGLIKAIKKFKPNLKVKGKKVSFCTFAFTVMMNDVRLEIKKFNKQNHITKNHSGKYVHQELSLEDYFVRYDHDGGAMHSEYTEMNFKETPQLYRLRNMDEAILTSIVLEQRIQKLSRLERKIYQLHYIEGLSIKKIAVQLKKSHGTVREMFYNRMKPKFEQIHQELASAI